MNKRSFNRFFTYIKYIPKIPKIVSLMRNWPLYSLNWLHVIDKKATYYFRNGYKIETIEGIDACTINGVFVLEQYKKPFENTDHRTHPTVIDLGANIGAFSLYTKTNIPNAKIFCYEPVPKNFNVLSRNIKINNLKNITAYCLGVDKKEGRRSLYLEDSVSHSVFLDTGLKKEEQYIVITCVTLEKVFRDNKIDICDILKIDTEGSEYEILYNCPEDILKRIKKLY